MGDVAALARFAEAVSLDGMRQDQGGRSGIFHRCLIDRKSTRLNSSHLGISYAVFCLKDTATTEIYTLSLHDALPISPASPRPYPLMVCARIRVGDPVFSTAAL